MTVKTTGYGSMKWNIKYFHWFTLIPGSAAKFSGKCRAECLLTTLLYAGYSVKLTIIACWVAKLNAALCLVQSEVMKIINISFHRARIKPRACHVYGLTLVPLRYDWPHKKYTGKIFIFRWKLWKIFMEENIVCRLD